MSTFSIMTNRIIYYYQTFNTLIPILNNSYAITHIHVSSIHFGTNDDKSPYIHLNDFPPDNFIFNNVWQELQIASEKSIKIILMVGGAGGAFTTLFSDFETYYKMLYDTIKKYPFIAGIDLDVEENVDINDIKKLINRIDTDFGSEFIISMAPVEFALENDEPGLGGFVYKDLYNSPEGKKIDYFNGQFYGCFDLESYKKVIDNGYPEEKINIGMISSDFDSGNFNKAINTITQIKNTYPNFGGVFTWEYYDSPPDNPYHPEQWAIKMYNAIYPSLDFFCDLFNMLSFKLFGVL